MTADPFLRDDFRVLTPEAFDFVLNNELKRAVRSQNYLTLVLAEPRAEGREPYEAVRELARLIMREIRETDLVSASPEGRLSIVLLDADLQNSMRVIDRLVSRIENYEFPNLLRIAVGAACYPTHAVDAESLKRQAMSHPIVNSRGRIRSSADQN